MPDEYDQLRALEQRRCDAINSGRIDDLTAMLATDYVHIHMTGKIDDRDRHVGAIRSRPRRTERGELDIRVLGEVAILIGEQVNVTLQDNGSSSQVTAVCQQVAIKSANGWQFISCQLTRKQ